MPLPKKRNKLLVRTRKGNKEEEDRKGAGKGKERGRRLNSVKE
jgi:hypothetical protein